MLMIPRSIRDYSAFFEDSALNLELIIAIEEHSCQFGDSKDSENFNDDR